MELLLAAENGKGVIQTATEIMGGAADDDEGGSNCRRRQNPKKRIVALTACLLFLAFLIIALNTIINFIIQLVENEKIWKLYKNRCSNTTSSLR